MWIDYRVWKLGMYVFSKPSANYLSCFRFSGNILKSDTFNRLYLWCLWYSNIFCLARTLTFKNAFEIIHELRYPNGLAGFTIRMKERFSMSVVVKVTAAKYYSKMLRILLGQNSQMKTLAAKVLRYMLRKGLWSLLHVVTLTYKCWLDQIMSEGLKSSFNSKVGLINFNMMCENRGSHIRVFLGPWKQK